MKEIVDLSKKDRITIVNVILAALTASICCVGPLLLIGLGVSGAWIGNLTLLEPFRPYLMTLTFGILGYAFYKIYKRNLENCEPGSYCSNPKSDKINKIVLWISTVFVFGLLSVPYLAEEILASENVSIENGSEQFLEIKTITLSVPGMNCASCPLTVQKSLKKLEGVMSAKVTFKDKKAVVQYNPLKVVPENLIAATTNSGYPSTIIE